MQQTPTSKLALSKSTRVCIEIESQSNEPGLLCDLPLESSLPRSALRQRSIVAEVMMGNLAVVASSISSFQICANPAPDQLSLWLIDTLMGSPPLPTKITEFERLPHLRALVFEVLVQLLKVQRLTQCSSCMVSISPSNRIQHIQKRFLRIPVLSFTSGGHGSSYCFAFTHLMIHGSECRFGNDSIDRHATMRIFRMSPCVIKFHMQNTIQ